MKSHPDSHPSSPSQFSTPTCILTSPIAHSSTFNTYFQYILLPTPQWTDDASLARLADAPNVTLLEANADIDVILKRTRVLLAPSIWQECCPLVVMEAALRGNPNTLTRIP